MIYIESHANTYTHTHTHTPLVNVKFEIVHVLSDT